MPTMTVPSAAMRRLLREQINRKLNKATLAPAAVIAKKPSSPAPRRNPAPPTAPPAPRRAADGVAFAEVERARPTPAPTTPSPGPRSRHGATRPAEPAEEAIKSECIGKGAQVRVRTRVGTVSTGQHLVLWLRAVVEAAADEDGYLHVAYDYTNGKFPRVARVSPNDVKLHLAPADATGTAASSTGSSTTTSDQHSARQSSSSQQHDIAARRPRPTVAGKKLPLLRKLEKEMLG